MSSPSSNISPDNTTTGIADELRNLNNQLRAKIVSDALKKGTIGALTGAAFSFLLFKRTITLFIV